jgi:toxin CptA
MPSSPASSTSCSGCRIDWRPSRGLVAALVMLAVLAGGAVMASNLPETERPLLAGLVLLQGLLGARRAASESPATFMWDGDGHPARLRRAGRDIGLHAVAVEFRGPIVALSGRDAGGRSHRLVWWPDTLAAGPRRQLVLAARAGHRPDNPLPSMAA